MRCLGFGKRNKADTAISPDPRPLVRIREVGAENCNSISSGAQGRNFASSGIIAFSRFVPFLTHAICFRCSGNSQVVARFPHLSCGVSQRRTKAASDNLPVCCLTHGPTASEHQTVEGLRRLQDAQSKMLRYGMRHSCFPVFGPGFLICAGFPSPCLGCSVSSARASQLSFFPELPGLCMNDTDKYKATRHRLLLWTEKSPASEKR